MSMTMTKGLQLAIERAGTQRRLAQLLGISPQAVQQWSHVPYRHIIMIEKVTGVPREQLRPDLYRRGV
jgi:DNA-binding transcriptional regulator YdaS (Cro superfamily)